MVENDTLTYHVRKPSHAQAKTADQSLITQERSQKLDLLTHLLANLNQSLVVCGPDGIGKTTLVNILQERKFNSWLYCLVQGNNELSFEKILEQLASVTKPENPKTNVSLVAVFDKYAHQNKKIILIIDDAGHLVPGLITMLIQYAAANPVLRVVFVLTHDDLYLKNRTDRAIEDCHFIEIPPLSEKQCGEFLQYLAAKPFPQIAFNTISDVLIEKIYRETHGIPGKIIAELPDLSTSKPGPNPTTVLISAVAALVIIALGIQWFSTWNRADTKTPVDATRAGEKHANNEPALPQPKPSLALNSGPLLLSEQFGPENNAELFSGPQQANQAGAGVVNKNQTEVKIVPAADGEMANADNTASKSENKLQPDSLKDRLQADDASIELPSSDKPVTTQQPQLKQIENGVTSEEESPEGTAITEDGTAWIMSQPPENFTLQIMVLTREQAIKDVINKNQSLGQALTYIKKVSPNGREKFLLLYGSFANSESATKAKQSLPAEFRKSILRKISAIKNEAEFSR